MSAARVITLASPSISVWQPTDDAEVIGPGTAPTIRPIAFAQAAVLAAPLRTPASTTTVALPSAATRRLRDRNCRRVGRIPGGYSLTSRPLRLIRWNSAECPDGYGTSMPQASTATVTPSAARVARCAAPSMP